MSISKDQLIHFIEKPGLLKEQTIGELKEIVDEFPYFQSAQLLYTYNLFTLDNFRYAGYLKTCSIYATDRTILYQLFHPQFHPEVNAKVSVLAGSDIQETSALFELAEEKQITATEFSQLFSSQPTESETFEFELLSFDQPDNSHPLDLIESKPGPVNSPVLKEPIVSKPDGKVDLIEQFIKVNPSIQPRIENTPHRNEPFDLREVLDKRHRGRTAKSLWRWMKRRAAIEPGIGHLKQEHRMDRNRLKGMAGDRINAILSAAGMNFRKLLSFLEELLSRIFCWLFLLLGEPIRRSI